MRSPSFPEAIASAQGMSETRSGGMKSQRESGLPSSSGFAPRSAATTVPP